MPAKKSKLLSPVQAWKEKNPLLSTHVPKEVYEEVKRRAAKERRSVSQFLAIFLEQSFGTVTIDGERYPIATQAIEDD
jgi:CopG antitoxin of type II toxin-antitoxin system